MAGPTVVQLPNGEELEFPEGVSEEEMLRATEEYLASAEAPGGPPRFTVNALPEEQRIQEDEPWYKSVPRFVGSAMARGLGGVADFASRLPGLDFDSRDRSEMSPGAQELLGKEDAVRADIAATLEKLIPFDLAPRPTGAGGRMAEAAIMGAMGGPLGPGSIARNAAIGAGSGGLGSLGGDLAANVTPGARPIGEIIGALLGGGSTAALTNSRTVRALGPGGNAAEVLSGTIKPGEEAAIRQSAAEALAAREAGVPLNTIDALPGLKGPLSDIQDVLVELGRGNKTAANIRAQGPGLQNLGNRTVAELPGEVLPPQTVANTVQDAATTRIQDQRRQATTQYSATLDDQKTAARADATTDLRQAEGEAAAALDQFGANTQAEIDAAVNRAWIRGDLQAPPASAAGTPGKSLDVGEIGGVSGERVLAAERQLMAAQDAVKGLDQLNPASIVAAQLDISRRIKEATGNEALVADLQYLQSQIGNFSTSKELHNFIRSVQDNLPSTKALGNANRATAKDSVVGSALQVIKNLRDEATPAYKVADEVYKEEMAALNSLKKDTDVGMLAGPRGAAPDRAAARVQVYRMLEEGESPNVKMENSRLSSTLREIGRTDPGSLQDLLKTHLDGIMSKVFGAGQSGRPTETSGEGLTAWLGDASNPQNDARLNGFRILLEEIGRANKMSKSDVLAMQKGLDQLRFLANANARSSQRVTSMGRKELEGMLQDPQKARVVTLIGAHPGRAIDRWLRKKVSDKTDKRLDELLSDPNQVESLIALGRADKFTQRENAAWATMIGAALAQAGQEETPGE